MNLPYRIILYLCLSCSVCTPVVADNTVQTAEDPVVIAMNDWASQRVLSIAFGKLLNQLGINTHFLEIKVEDQWGGFSKGFIDVQVEVWQASTAERLQNLIRNRMVVDAGSHIATAREEWWYPEYVKPLCPGLPSWRALRKCSYLFANQQSTGKGIYYTGPWNANEGIRIRALDLNFVIKRLDNDMALWQLLSQSMKMGKPIILLNWTPNWTDTRIKGEFVEFPAYDEKCTTDPTWGINQKMLNDCANPKAGWVKKLASPRLIKLHPCAFEALKNIQFTTAMMAEASALVISDRYSEQQAAEQWIAQFELQWLSWLPENCQNDLL